MPDRTAERFEADYSRQYRVAVKGAPVVGFPLALVVARLAGLELPWLLVWPAVCSFALLSQRWVMLGIRYELDAERITVVFGPFRTYLAWSAVAELQRSRQRQLGVDGFTLVAHDGRTLGVAPRDRGGFIRAVAARAPHVRFEDDPAGSAESDAARLGPAA